MSKVRLQDIAVRAGVSVSTVSLVLNNKTLTGNVRISDETSRQVRGIALEMGYLSKGIIGLIVPQINSYFAGMIDGVMGVLKEENYSLAIGRATYWHLEREIEEVRLMEEKGFDCLIMGASPQFVIQSETSSHLFQDSKRVVLMNWMSHSGIPSVTVDHEQCGYLATKHLLDMGHRRVACSSFHPYPTQDHTTNVPIVDARFQGYTRAMKEYDQPYISVSYAKDIFDLPEKVTGIYCCRALEAAEFLGTCWDQGMKLPETLSVVGQDNDREKQIVRPRLTTVDVQSQQVGIQAAHMALDLIDGKEPESVVLSPKLVVRDSVQALETK